MIDKGKFDYIPESHPNIVFECQKGITRNQLRVTLDSRISLLANNLVKRRPNWVIVCRGHTSYHQGQSGVQNKIYVYEDQIKVGEVDLNMQRSGSPYRINSKRANKSNSYGHAPNTKDLKKAVNLCLQYFKPESMDERISRLESETSQTMTNTYYTTHRDVSGVQQIVGQNLDLFGDEILDMIMAKAESALDKAAAEEVIQYKKYKNKQVNAVKIHQEFENKEGCYVVIDAGQYYVYSRKMSSTEVFTTDTLPVKLKESVGLLKLLAKNKYQDYVGLRVGDNEFYIME